ncbi:3-phosphoshikimate 1-carboxyvinyltransferase [Candidatus Parcubacteria bacterium]|nr:3-phosphoshikimate 1-carboxyvinyltransferase [Candidatus Parcubacteria bacterium]MBT3948914.1 3-phosphoshikimate 1-carboxyvinyltransferase [Candidatus Parcubacteria bacterium]
MKLRINTTQELNGSVTPPSSKSQTIRGLILAILAKGTSILHNPLESDDTDAAIDVCRGLGSEIIKEGNSLVIKSSGVPLKNIGKELNSKNSGITTRFVMPLLGLRKDNNEEIILNCGDQMKQRPLGPMINSLKKFGMNIDSEDERCPLKISGTLQGGSVEVDGTTSQYVSALLLSASYVKQDVEIVVRDLHERPYVDMTLQWLTEAGIKYTHEQKENVDIYKVKSGQTYQPFEKQIPVDFSSLSYPLAAACMIPGEVVLKGIDMNENQGDKRLVYILKEMGADIEINKDRLIIRGGKPLYGLEIDANDIPDMLPTLAVIGTYAQGKTKIVNVAQARIKETDRIHSMATELKKMGAEIEEQEDGLVVEKSYLRGSALHGYEDHRTIMALSLAGMIAQGETVIDTAEGISKTFPNYVQLMQELGAKIK